MVMTVNALLFLGSLALIATIGSMMDLGDEWTPIVSGFVGSLLWGLFGINAFDVLVVTDSVGTRSEPILTFVAVGVVFAAMLMLLTLHRAIETYRAEATTRSGETPLSEI